MKLGFNIFQNERKYLGATAQRYEKTNEKYEVHFNIFQQLLKKKLFSPL